MDNLKGTQWVSKWQRKWSMFRLLSLLGYSLSISLLISALVCLFIYFPWWMPLLMGILGFFGWVYFSGTWKISPERVAGLLDAHYPALEYSTSLFLKPFGTLGILQQMQLRQLTQRIPYLPEKPPPFHAQLYKPVALLSVAVLVFYSCSYISQNRSEATAGLSVKKNINSGTKAPLPGTITSTQLTISPPAYTRLPVKRQSDLSISSPNGSTILIEATNSRPVMGMKMLLNGQQEIAFKSRDSLHWVVDFKPSKNGFYQIGIDGKWSSLYMVEVISDLPVSIAINKPELHTVIDAGYTARVPLHASLTDDYAIEEISLTSTVAIGKGESVRFQPKEIAIPNFKKGQKEFRIQQAIDLHSLEMKPGEELYFYITAKDNAGQESKSDMYIVAWQDTAELLSMSGMVAGVDLVPEYFRSQRQIIIETEQLLKDMPGLGNREAHHKSNDLGTDQKLLRLRYGQFLGEEAESEIGGHHDHDEHDDNGHNEHEGEEVPVDVHVLMDQLVHHHDNAEDATFFTPQQKMMLKATLTEMWNAELKLRTFKPQEALPYAYKAGRLLKELQQQSRAYVGKSPAKTTPLKIDKRLSGDLGEILSPILKKEPLADSDIRKKERSLKKTLSLLSALREGEALNVQDTHLLKQAENSLIDVATNDPTHYLPALKAIRLIEEKQGKGSNAEIQVLERAIAKLLPIIHDQPIPHTIKKENIYSRYLELIPHQ